VAKKREFSTVRDVLWAFERSLGKIRDAHQTISRAQEERKELAPFVIEILKREGCAIESGGSYFRLLGDGSVVVEPIKSSYSLDTKIGDIFPPELDEEAAHENEAQDSIAAHERSLADPTESRYDAPYVHETKEPL
jgi:hypothetical protein